MECDKAEGLMMLHMDRALNDKNKALLDEHLKGCPSCREDFYVYDKMLSELSIQKVYSPPAGFEAEVMERVRALDYKRPVNSVKDSLFCVVCGVLSILFGLAINIAPYSKTLGLAAAYISDFTAAFMQAGAGLGEAFLQFRFVLLLICLALAAAQYLLSSKNKAEF